jgi:hypothetical protein
MSDRIIRVIDVETTGLDPPAGADSCCCRREFCIAEPG